MLYRSSFAGVGLFAVMAFGCGDDTGTGGAQGGEAPGGQAEGGEPQGGAGGQAEGGQAEGGGGGGGEGGAPEMTIDEACEALCTNSAAVETELACEGNPGSPTCVSDCVNGGDAACAGEYLDLIVCSGEEVSTEACTCGENGGLDCDTCVDALSAYVDCVSA